MSQATQHPAPLVWINGFAGVGKLTIARILITLLGGPAKAQLIDNHTLIDVVILDRHHPDYQLQRRNARQSCFERYVLDGDMARVVVFTDWQSDNDLGRSVAAEYREAAERAGRKFVPVYLECEKEENVKRAIGRSTEGKSKLTDEEVLRKYLDQSILFEFEDMKGWRFDVTDRSPENVAAELAGIVSRHTEGDG